VAVKAFIRGLPSLLHVFQFGEFLSRFSVSFKIRMLSTYPLIKILLVAKLGVSMGRERSRLVRREKSQLILGAPGSSTPGRVQRNLEEHDVGALAVSSNGALLETSGHLAEIQSAIPMKHAAHNPAASDVQVWPASGMEAISTTLGVLQTIAAVTTAMPSYTTVMPTGVTLQSQGQLISTSALQPGTVMTTAMPTAFAFPAATTAPPSIVDAQSISTGTTLPGTTLPGTTLSKQSAEAAVKASPTPNFGRLALIFGGFTVGAAALICLVYNIMRPCRSTSPSSVISTGVANRIQQDDEDKNRDKEAWQTSKKQQSYTKSDFATISQDDSDVGGRRERVS